MTAADQWGRADADGTVWVKTADGERIVGQYPGVTQPQALAYFARKYEELAAQVNLLEQRLKAGQVSPPDAAATIARLRPAIENANAVGDLAGLLQQLNTLAPLAAEQREQAQQARREARDAAIASREAIVAEAEQLSSPAAERIPWKTSGDRLRTLFDEWRKLQRDSRLDKSAEDELWRRFSHARTTFDRKRRHHFGALDEQRSAARQEKEKLVAEAERLASSTDWSATTTAFRDLMALWKQAGRASHRDDDALWSKFHVAQESFFAAKQQANTKQDAEFAGNAQAKEALLKQAEALLPVRDLSAAKAALRDLQSRWDAIGKVPRADIARLDGRLRKVEQAVRDAEQDRWKKANPQARARAADLVGQLEDTIAGLESTLAKASASGDARRIQETEQALAARREWLVQAERALREFAG